MENTYKFESPYRMAKKDDEYLIFNIYTLDSIYLDKLSYEVFNFIEKNKQLTLSDIYKYSESLDIKDESVDKLLEFLELSKFISKVG